MNPEDFKTPTDLQMKSAVRPFDQPRRKRVPVWVWIVLASIVAVLVFGIAIAIRQ